MLHAVTIDIKGRSKPHRYQLGLGPCGRVVTKLEARISGNQYVVLQFVEGEARPAVFSYPAKNVLRYAQYEYNPNVCPLAPKED